VDPADLEDLLAWKARRDGARLRALAPQPGDPAATDEERSRDERLRDRLRSSLVRDAAAAALGAPPGPAGERAREPIRLLLAPFLDFRTRDAEREFLRIRRELDEPEGGFAAAIRGEEGFAARAALQRRWERADAQLERARRERFAAREDAAREVGAQDLPQLLGGAHPVPGAVVVADVERVAIAPRDSLLASRARERGGRFRHDRAGPPDGWEAPLLAGLAEHRRVLDERAIVRTVAAVGSALGLDPNGRGPSIRRSRAAESDAESLESAPVRPAVILSGWGGPAGLAAALGAFGRAARAAMHRESGRGMAVSAADPALGFAAEHLFRRLILSSRFGSWAGLEPDDDRSASVRFEETVALRIAWALADLALRRARGAEERVFETLERAAGRPASLDLVARTWEADPGGASALRGASLAVLVEERLRTRWGNLWFLERGSRIFLREMTEAESAGTAECMATDLELGTMDASLLADGYRP
jgi:hypothetical protein